MKNPRTSQASQNFLGMILLLGLFGTTALAGIENLSDLYAAFKNQWQQFGESISMLHPHRAVLP